MQVHQAETSRPPLHLFLSGVRRPEFPDGAARPMEWTIGDLVLRREPGPALPLPAPAQECTSVAGQTKGTDHLCVILAEGLLQGRRAPLLHIGRARALMAGALPAGPGPIAQDRPFLTLLLPRDETLPDAGAPAGTGVGIDAMRGQGALLAQFLWNLSEQIGQVPQDRLGSVASAARALVMACLDQAAMTPRLVAQENHPPLAAFIERARLGVRENMASPEFGPRELARLLAMSRSKLYRLLLKEGGVAHFINRERLLQARSCLAAQEGPVSIHAVAAQVGFRDHSTFSRAFRREFGVTPSEARQVSPFRLSEPFGKVS